MLVYEHPVLVEMHMRLRDAFARRVRMPVMFIVAMRVRMREWLVRMPVLVPLREVQPYAADHQAASQPEGRRGRFTQQNQGHGIAVAQRADGSACPGCWMSRFL
jgi:hypothetical protein